MFTEKSILKDFKNGALKNGVYSNEIKGGKLLVANILNGLLVIEVWNKIDMSLIKRKEYLR